MQMPVTFNDIELCRPCVESCAECRRKRPGDHQQSQGPAHRKPCGVSGHPQRPQLYLYRCLDCGNEMTDDLKGRPCDLCASRSIARTEALPETYLVPRIAPFCLDCHLYHDGGRERRSAAGEYC